MPNLSDVLAALLETELPPPLPSSRDLLGACAAGAVTVERSSSRLIFSYTPAGARASRWRHVTRYARGLIIDTNSLGGAAVAGRPLQAFIDVEEGEPLPDIEGEPEVTKKLDGSLVIGYWANGAVRFSGRTSFTSLPARIANEIWGERHRPVPENLTVICEVEAPELRTIIPSNGRCLTVIAGIDRFTGKDLSYADTEQLASQLGLPVVPLVPWPGALDSLWTRIKNEGPVSEGFVLRWADGTRARLVHPDYGPLYDLVVAQDERLISMVWLERRDVRRLIDRLPTDAVARVLPTLDRLDRLSKQLEQRGHTREDAVLVTQAAQRRIRRTGSFPKDV